MTGVIESVDEALGAISIKRGIDVRLQRQHVSRRELFARFQHPINSFRSPRRFPFGAQAVRILVGSDTAIGSRQDSPRRVENAGQLVKRNMPLPFMSIITSIFGETAIA